MKFEGCTFKVEVRRNRGRRTMGRLDEGVPGRFGDRRETGESGKERERETESGCSGFFVDENAGQKGWRESLKGS